MTASVLPDKFKIPDSKFEIQKEKAGCPMAMRYPVAITIDQGKLVQKNLESGILNFESPI
jgi:hypothetical protein